MTINLVKFNFKFRFINLVTILRCNFFKSKQDFIAWKEREEEVTYTTYVKDQSPLP